MATYKCNSCGMSVKTLCGSCDEPLVDGSLTTDDGKEVQIRGFIIPVDIVQDYYVLSANPYSSCFFCGQAGPESVMEIEMIKKYEGLRMDQVITFRGRLKLNVDDIYQLNYILQNAEILE